MTLCALCGSAVAAPGYAHPVVAMVRSSALDDLREVAVGDLIPLCRACLEDIDEAGGVRGALRRGMGWEL